MRALFEDLKYGATLRANFRLLEVGLPAALPSSKRDLYFHIQRDATTGYVYAYKTREEALAEGESYVAYLEGFLITGATQIVTLTRLEGAYPDLTGLQVRFEWGTAPGTLIKAVWCYTAAPDLVIGANLVEILGEYLGNGKALYGLSSDLPTISLGDVGDAFPAPMIAVTTGQVVLDEPAQGGTNWTARVPVSIEVFTLTLESSEAAWRLCRQTAAAVTSIVADERRLCRTEGRGFELLNVSGPNPHDRNPLAYVETIELEYLLTGLWKDETWPRW